MLSRRTWSPRGWRGAGASVLAQLAHASLLADLAAKVVELRAVDVADRTHLDLVDLGRVERERALDTHAERVLAHREGLARAGALALDHDPLEHLDPLAGALDHAKVDAYGVAGLEPRNLAELAALDVLDDRTHGNKGPKAAAIVADSRRRAAVRGVGAGGGPRLHP